MLGVAGLNNDAYASVQDFTDYLGLTFPVLYDEDGEVNMAYAAYGDISYGILAPPSEMFIDAEGIIRYYAYSFDIHEVQSLVEDALR